MTLSKRSTRKIQAILDVASKLFQDHGYHKITMDEISKEAHVSKATLYKYFANKQALYEHIFQDNYLKEYERIRNIIDSQESFQEKINQVIKVRLKKYKDQSIILYQNEFSFSKEMHQFIETHSAQMEKARAELYKQGRLEGCIRQDLSDELLQMYFKVIQEGLRRTFMEFTRLEEKELASLMNILYAGILECPKKKTE